MLQTFNIFLFYSISIKITLNGQQIYSEALADIEKLEQELRTTYELNPAMLIG